jgi:hypothetical protein
MHNFLHGVYLGVFTGVGIGWGRQTTQLNLVSNIFGIILGWRGTTQWIGFFPFFFFSFFFFGKYLPFGSGISRVLLDWLAVASRTHHLIHPSDGTMGTVSLLYSL